MFVPALVQRRFHFWTQRQAGQAAGVAFTGVIFWVNVEDNICEQRKLVAQTAAHFITDFMSFRDGNFRPHHHMQIDHHPTCRLTGAQVVHAIHAGDATRHVMHLLLYCFGECGVDQFASGLPQQV